MESINFFSVSAVDHPTIPLQTFRSRLEPNDVERSRTLVFMADEEGELERCIRELNRLHDLTDKLASRKAVLEQRINERKSWTSATFRVPKEVWGEIFTLACQPESSVLDVTSAKMRVLPLVISHVSSYWREIILGLSKPWSSITVDLCNVSVGMKTIVELHLQKSGSQPLDLCIRTSSSFDYPPGVSLLKEYLGGRGYSLLEKLVSEFPRCKSLTIDFETRVLLSFPKDLKRKISFPLLQSFSYLYAPPRGDDDDDDDLATRTKWLWQKIYDAPLLRELILPNDSLFQVVDTTRLPNNLTTLSIGDAFLPDSVFDDLSMCPNLTTLTWTGYTDNTVPSIPATPYTEPIQLSNIRKMCLSHLPGDVLDAFIASVTLPALESASLGPLKYNGGHWRGEKTLSTMLERSQAPKLKELKLDFPGSHLSLDGLCGILGGCMALTSLEVMVKRDVDEQGMDDGFIGALVSRLTMDPSADMALIANLAHLRLHEVLPRSQSQSISREIQERIIRMAESRSRSEPGLQRLHVSLSAKRYPLHDGQHQELDLELDLAARVQVLQRQGMECLLEWVAETAGHEPDPNSESDEYGSDWDDEDQEDSSE